MYPENLKYTKTHEWVKVEDDVATIGITSYAVEQLIEIIGVYELPEPGSQIEPSGSLGLVESTKASSDVLSPLGGKVLEVNESLEEDPGIINKDPYGEGWLIKIEMKDKSNLDELLSAEEYEEFLKSEEAKK